MFHLVLGMAALIEHLKQKAIIAPTINNKNTLEKTATTPWKFVNESISFQEI